MQRPVILPLAVAIAAMTLTATAPAAGADPETELAAAMSTERAAANCPPLQSVPAVEQVARMASQNTREYAAHETAAVPFTDPMLALSTIGHPASQALLLSGYGANPTDAVHGAVLQYRAWKPDCSYTQQGVSLLPDDAGDYIASVVLVAP